MLRRNCVKVHLGEPQGAYEALRKTDFPNKLFSTFLTIDIHLKKFFSY